MASCGLCKPDQGYFCVHHKQGAADKARQELKNSGWTQQQINALGNDGALRKAKAAKGLSWWRKLFG